MENIKWEIPYNDRVGLISDISQIVSLWNINIKSFELHETKLYIELEGLRENLKSKLSRELKQIDGVKGIKSIQLLPWEQREKQLQAVLDAVGEGIVAVDRDGDITNINPVARKILSLGDENVIGQHIGKILAGDIPILNCLRTGKPYNNREMFFNSPKGRIHFLSSGRPLLDKKGQVIGAVALVKDISEVHQLVYEVTKPSMTTFDEIMGESPTLKQAINLAKMVAKGNSTVLLRGESGTGKELFARAIHMASPRSSQPFVPVNCAALPDALLESELFGYVEGAFTGAQKGGKAGLFEFANKGTIFLDEIGEVSPHLQAKLLRVLQEGKVRRIGDRTETPVDVRIIAATNRNLEEMIKKEAFREDLYYRLNVVPVFTPPLRARKEDIAVLTEFFIDKLCYRLGKNVVAVSTRALIKLERYDWPGNVRELENVVERAMIMTQSDLVEEEHIILDRYQDGGNPQIRNYTGSTLKEAVEKVEMEIIRQSLKETSSIRQAARNLGVSHTTIINKLNKFQSET